MKPFLLKIIFIPAIFFSFLGQSSYAQVKLKQGNLNPSLNISKAKFSKKEISNSLFENRYFVLLTFNKIPAANIQNQLKEAGIQLLQYFPGNSYMAAVEEKFDFSALRNFDIISVDELPVKYKIDAAIRTQQNYEAASLIAVSYFDIIDRKKAAEILIKTGAVIIKNKFDNDGLIFIKASPEQINNIALLPFVFYISRQTVKDIPLNYNNNAAHGNDALSYNGIGGRSLTGKDVTIGVGDDGDVSSHIDFTGRLINRNGEAFMYHGTHTTGTAAGAGLIDPKKKGMSPGAEIVSQYFSGVLINAPLYYKDNNLTLTNNSYYSANAGCSGNSEYNMLSNYLDAQTKSYDDLLHVIAAGNDGAMSCSVYPSSFGTIKSGWQTAKNVLTVGAIDNTTNTIAAFSSRGPVADGRLKPEIVAGGVAILSTTPNNTYGSDAGTSMAAPTVAGSLALLTQRYKQLNGNKNPKGFLLKALICNSAEDLGNAGPDFTYGFGKLNTRRAVEDMEANNYSIDSISNGAMKQHSIIVPAGAKQLKVLLYWPDKEAPIYAATTLVNDLDISVKDPSTVSHLPLILNNSPANINNPAVEGADHLNNIEQVVIDNPVAGNYTINISGYAVPFGLQPYAVAYEFVTPSIFIEYPFGGETLVPGESETIRWSATDGNTNAFTVEYSGDNGNSWQLINNNVPASQRSVVWTVPATATNTGSVRVSRNATVVSATSSYNFSVLGQPVLTPAIPCDGYIQLDWPAINSATAYDIFMLTGDSMKAVATTPANSFLIKGLEANKTYWLAVAAKNGIITGRRSIAKSIVTATGACTLPAFDNDLKLISIDEPLSGRQFTSTAAMAAKPIKVQIKNLDNAPSSGAFDISYSINGSPAVTETIAPAFTSGGIYIHTFAQHTILPGVFVDTIKVWLTKTADLQHDNDTAYKIVKLLPNPVSVLPYNEGFETAANSTYTNNTTGLDGLDNVDFSTNTAFGRARSFVNTGFAYAGTRALTLDQAPKNVSSTSDSLILTSNLSNYNAALNQLRLDFFYKNNGQDNFPGNAVWLRGSDTAAWLPVYDLFANQADIGQYKAVKGINISDIFLMASPPQNVSSSFQVKFGEQGFTSSNSPYPDFDADDGYTFDNIKISEALNDVGVIKIVYPSGSNCGLNATNPVSISIKNYSNMVLNNVQVGYRINNGTPVIETIPVLNAKELLDFTFATTADMSAYIDYNVDAWVSYPADNYPGNDSILNYSFHNSPLITTFPYLEGFEASNGNWYTKGANSSWEWGTPSNTMINKAANGSKAWVTNLTGNYNDNELSYLYSPCFNLSSLTQPVLSFSHIHQLEDDCNCDYHWVEYSTDGGVSWNTLGAKNSGTNWYDNATYQRWQQSNTRWQVSSIDIPSNAASVRFRFVLNSDAGVNYEGVGIDDIHIFDKKIIYTGADASTPTQLVSGNTWVDFDMGGNRVVSINPNGQNLGATSVKVYFNTGPVRTSNNQYYLDRNIVIQPAIQPAADVSVRYFFTDNESQLLINATGCSSCSTIHDAYAAGVTKFSGNAGEENGSLADDTTGFYKFIIPADVDIVPYDNGYYAEYKVNSFSEFWIDSGGPSGLSPLPITLLNFDADKDNNNAKLTWSTSQEINSDKFIIERSANGIDFISIGEVKAKGNSNILSNYTFMDLLTLPNTNYYRLKMLDNSLHSNYSIIRQLNFNKNNGAIKIFPNPVTTGKVTIKTPEECRQIELLNVAGQRLKIIMATGTSNTIDIGKLPYGVYQLKIFTATNTTTLKINVE